MEIATPVTVERVMFWVPGRPQPAGSKRAFPIRRKTGAMGVAVTDDNPATKGWQAVVLWEAAGAMDSAGAEMFAGPLGLAVTFTLRRPKGHFGSGRNADKLRDSAPRWPIVKPDATKLLRAVEDAMSGVVWRDDAQVVEQMASKVYGSPEGAQIAVWKL